MTISKTSVRSVLGHRHGAASVAFSFVGLVLSAGGCSCDEGPPPLGSLHPTFQADQDALDFGEVPIGARKDMPLKIKDTGELQLIVCAAAPADGMMADSHCAELTHTDPTSAGYSAVFEGATDQGSWVVDSAAEREMVVRFVPAVEGKVDASLIIFHNGNNGPSATIALTGVGVKPQVDVSPMVLDFGEVTVGQRKSLDITLTNRTAFAQPTSLGPINETMVIFGTTNDRGDDTQAGQPMNVEVAGNGTLTVKAYFSPLEEGQATNMLTISICPATSCQQQIMLVGQGVKPAFELDPAALDFGTMNVGAMATKTFDVKNIGHSALTVSDAQLEAGTTSEYVVTPQVPLPTTIAPGMTVTFSVTYTGSTPGTDTGRVQVTTNAWNDPGTPSDEGIGFVSLNAISTGPDIDALPPAVNFGTVAIMTGMANQTVEIVNQGNSDLTVSNIQLNGPTPEISLTTVPGLPATIPGGGSVQVVLHYAPVDAGVDMAQLVITSNDPDENPLVINVQGIGGQPNSCALSVTPPNVNFGLVERGRRANLPVDVHNTGVQPCNITNVHITGDMVFGITNPMNLQIMPGGSSRIEVSYSPTAYGMNSGSLDFGSDDPARPTVSVPLAGSSAMSTVRVLPSDLDFSIVPVTCGSPIRTVTVYNTGVSAVTVNRVYLDPSTSPEFELCAAGGTTRPWCTARFNTPASIPAGGNVAIQLRYRPMDIGTDNGVLFIEHSASLVPVAVPLVGRSDVQATVTDRFTQLPTPQADVLFVLDNSCSMDDEQASLGANFGSFLTYAQSAGVDYQIAVTTTDVESPAGAFDPSGLRTPGPGRFVDQGGGQIITPSTPNAAQVFQQNTTLGTYGSGHEQGLEGAYLALSDPNINGPNHGFLRVDAALAVIVVSDEEDQSPRTVAFYENFFRNIKGFQNQSQFSFSAIVSPPANPNCSGGGASAGNRYISIAQSTGGVVESICTANWGQTLSNIGLNTFGLRGRFNLSAQPIPSTIAVTVNSMAVAAVTPGGVTQWRYDVGTNSVNFQPGFVPMANNVIEITYTVACLP
ncbi:MAG: choice-of-anchor D domain-containing protein [Myxococcota bacterium]